MTVDPNRVCPSCGGPITYYARRCQKCPRYDYPANGHNFAKRWFPMPELCEDCGVVPPLDRHHKDGNPRNNDAENIAFLCRRCHMAQDGRLKFVREVMPRMGGATKRQSLSPTSGDV